MAALARSWGAVMDAARGGREWVRLGMWWHWRLRERGAAWFPPDDADLE